MTFLPMVERELRERARKRATYWVRGGAAFLATAIAMFVLIFMSGMGSGAIGHSVMEVLAWLAFPFVVLEGLRNTADSLSAEKREGTLGLLFLTDLRGYDVVLGKFFACSLTSLYALLAMIPALAVPVLLGGVTGAEFWRLVLALINALFFSLTTGIFVSSISRVERRSWAGTFAIIGFFIIALPALSGALKLPELCYGSPFTSFWLHDASRYAVDAEYYWGSIWITHAIGWGWLGFSSFLLPRFWQESGKRRTQRRREVEPERAHRRRNIMLAVNPIWWLTSRRTHQRTWLWLMVTVVAILAVASFATLQDNTTGLWAIYGCMMGVHLLLAVWVAFEACDSFSEARGTGAMELLLSTPLPVRQILRGQHLALRELFLGPVGFLLGVEILLTAVQVSLMARGGGNFMERVAILLVLGFSLVWFILDLLAVAEVGMWFGLTSQKSTQAMTKTILIVLVLPLLGAACCYFILPGLMVAKSVIFYTWAQSKLESEFRRAATERYDLPRTRKWLGGRTRRLKMPQ